jgi:glycosyltransferase involved in cell wall biosynthesis
VPGGPDARRPISGAQVLLIWNGFQYNIAGPVADYLVARGATVTTVAHPLFARGPRRRILTRRGPGIAEHRDAAPLGLCPPASYALDPLWPPRLPRADLAIGFGCLVTTRLLVERALGRVGTVVHWNIDFVPRRFESRALDRTYRFLDRQACLRADVRLELNERALEARTEAYGLSDRGATPLVVPVGIWTAESERCKLSAFDAQRLVFLGNLAERQGIFEFVDATAELTRTVPGLRADVIGDGAIMGDVQAHARAQGLAGKITFHGEIVHPKELNALLAECTIGFAPYRKDPASFSNYADPSKVKSYLGAALPIVITDVPPIARHLEARGAAVITEPEGAAVAAAARTLLGDRAAWEGARHAASAVADELDWNRVGDELFDRLGWT